MEMDGLRNSLLALINGSDTTEITVDLLESALSIKVAHGNVIAALKSLEKHGHGTFITGRKGKPSRFSRVVKKTIVRRTRAKAKRDGKLSVSAPQQMAAREARDTGAVPEPAQAITPTETATIDPKIAALRNLALAFHEYVESLTG